jgi:CBS domain-containing protein
MRAKHVMTEFVYAVPADATIFDAAELLVTSGVSAAPVVDESGKMVGIVSEADLMCRAEIGTTPHKSWLVRLFTDDVVAAGEYVRSHSHRVGDVMTKNVVTASEDTKLGELAELMHKNSIKRIPILRDGWLVGIVSRANLLQALLSREPFVDVQRVPDDEIRRAVIEALEKQGWSSAWPTNVVVNSGVVHLWGFVTSDAVRKAFRVTAENVPGVKGVKNHLRAVPPGVNMGV